MADAKVVRTQRWDASSTSAITEIGCMGRCTSVKVGIEISG
jgi:hypothetical protein